MRIGRPFSTRYKPGDIVSTSKYGDFEVISVKSAISILCRSKTTGYEIIKQATHLDNKSIKDPLYPSILNVGFMGVGDYQPKRYRTVYQKWKNMLTRCYDEKYLSRNPSYVGYVVCDEWHNFQRFAEWCLSVGYTGQRGLELDKDIKANGKKEYSPETCSFVSRQKNSEAAHCKEVKFLSPAGEVVKVINVSKFARKNGLLQSHLSSVLSGKRNHHKGWRRVQAQPKP